ncbi:integrase [Anaerophilus nitritogenes]|uniref:integrase n=1 Tax=Anaerophilus nitritogenes TaxID=2498136 RepID=UPI00101C07EC|nr:integrase [Anaerophilus nitritogenes]
MTIQIEKENEKILAISFSYSFDRVKKMKSIEGSYWNEKKKSWIIPYNKEKLLKFLSLFSDEEIITKDALDCFMMMR